MKSNNLNIFFKSSIIYALGTIGCKFVSFLLLPLNTSHLNPLEYGTADLIIVIVSLILPISTLEIGTGMYKYLLSSNEKNKIVTNGILILILGTSIVSFLSIIIGMLLDFEFAFLLMCLIFFGSFRISLLPISRGLGYSKNYAISGIVSTIITVITNVVLIKFTPLRVEAILISSILADLILSLYLIYSTKLFLYISIDYMDLNCINSLLKFSIPIIPNSFSWWIDNSLAKIILNKSHGGIQNGYLAVVQKFPNLFNTLFSVLSLAWNDVTIKDQDNDDKQIFQSKFMSEMLVLLMEILTIIIIAIKISFPFLVDKQYTYSFYFIPVFIIAVSLSCYSDLFSSSFLSSGETKYISLTSLSSSFVGLIFAINLIPLFGILGAGLSLLIAKALLMVIRFILIKKKYYLVSINSKHLIVFIILLVITGYYYYQCNILIDIAICIIIIFIFIFMNLKILKRLYFIFMKGKKHESI